jgi:hypothetical protein
MKDHYRLNCHLPQTLGAAHIDQKWQMNSHFSPSKIYRKWLIAVSLRVDVSILSAHFFDKRNKKGRAQFNADSREKSQPS